MTNMIADGYVRYHAIVTAASMLNKSFVETRDLLDIRFSNRYTRYAATCWPNQYKILFYRPWITANLDNLRIVDDIIVHECAHLATGPEHDERFYSLCRKYGAQYEDWYLEDVPYMFKIPDGRLGLSSSG